MYTYLVTKANDEVAFHETFKRIEENCSDLEIKRLLEDVDGSLMQGYVKGDKGITVWNDYEAGTVYVESEISIDNIFPYYIQKSGNNFENSTLFFTKLELL